MRRRRTITKHTRKKSFAMIGFHIQSKGFNDTFSLPLFDVMSLKVKRRPDSSNGLNVAQKLQLTTNHSNSIAWARFWFWYGFGSGFGFSFGFGFGSGHRLQFWDSGT